MATASKYAAKIPVPFKPPPEWRVIAALGDVALMMLDDKNYKTSDLKVVSPETIVGVELEIENFTSRTDRVVGMTAHVDGSLRNNGIEFVTLPTKLKYLDALLQSFFTIYPITEANYSERTSVHVHVNCQNLSAKQIAGIALVYQTFERMLFNFIGQDRANSIFCVPWYQASNTINLSKIIEGADFRSLRRWQKYTALNLLPLTDRGTIEYRHLYGTCDKELIMRWVNIITSIHSFGSRNQLEKIKEVIKELNTSSAYNIFLTDVFGQYSDFLKVEGWQLAMEQGVIDSKIMLFDEDKIKPEEDDEDEPEDFLDETFAPPPPVRNVPRMPVLGEVPGQMDRAQLLRDLQAIRPRTGVRATVNLAPLTAVWEPVAQPMPATNPRPNPNEEEPF